MTYSAYRPNGTALPSWLALNPSTGLFSGIAAYSDAELLQMLVNATDANGDNRTLSLTFHINAPPTDLYVVPNEIQVYKGNTYQYDFNTAFEDYNGDNMTFYLESGPDWATMTTTGRLIMRPVDNGFSYLTLKACDTWDTCTTKVIVINSLGINWKPFVDQGMPDIYVKAGEF